MGFIKYLLWLLFPKRCASCGEIIKRKEVLCAECTDKIEWLKKPCLTCGCDKKHCECFRHTYHFRAAVAPFNYGDYSLSAILNFKRNDNLENADFFVEHMAKAVSEYYSGIKFDYVVCMPMHPLKKFRKGYNHSEVIAKKISKIIGVPFYDCLRKIKMGKSQHSTEYKERFSNVRGAYSSIKIKANNILLVDDIKTTGASLDECARQLMFAGAHNVYCVTALSNHGKTRKEQLKK